MHFLIAEGSSSSADASSTSRVVIALGVADTATHRTYSSARDECLLLLSSLVAKLDNESGMLFGRGWYLTLNLLGHILRTYLSMCAHGLIWDHKLLLGFCGE